MTAALASPARLSKDEIVTAATELIAEVGVAGFTMRLLAERLGVTQGAAYRHLPGKAAILGEVAASAFASVHLDDASTGDWSDRLQAQALMIYDVFAALPGLGSFVLSQPGLPDTSLPFRDWILGVLRDAGLPDPAAYRVLGVFSVVAMSALALDPARSLGTWPKPPRPTAVAEARTVFAEALVLVLRGLSAELAAGSR